MEKYKIDRINELTRISRERELTPQEKKEREALRREYINNIKAQLTGELDNTYIVNPDGSRTSLKEKAEGADKMKVKIMTCNVWADVFGNPVKERDECLARVILKYMPDAVSFQEMHPNWHRSKLQEELFTRGYKEAEAELSGNPLNYTPVYYRADVYELIETGFHKFSGPNDYDSKSATWAVLKDRATGKTFCNIATHFYYESNEKGENARRQNSREILEISENIRKKYGIPVFLGGDLNCDLLSEPYRILEEGGLKCASLTAKEKTNCICTWHEYPKYNKETEKYTPANLSDRENKYSIDHILTTKDAAVLKYEVVTEEDAKIASDHCPVYIEAEI